MVNYPKKVLHLSLLCLAYPSTLHKGIGFRLRDAHGLGFANITCSKRPNIMPRLFLGLGS